MPKIKTSMIAPVGGSGKHCHFLIAETAQAMAHSLYDDCMRDNKIWLQWKEMCPELTRTDLEDRFVDLLWPKLIEQARATLAKMLSGPYDQVLKDQIADALIKDGSLRRGRDHTSAGYRTGAARKLLS
jgi:hypothetical protein